MRLWTNIEMSGVAKLFCAATVLGLGLPHRLAVIRRIVPLNIICSIQLLGHESEARCSRWGFSAVSNIIRHGADTQW